MKVALIVGHDYNSRGAYGNMGISEFKFNDELLQELFFYNQLPENNEYHIFYRDSDINGYSNKMIDLHRRIDEWEAEVSIEFHFNSFSDENVNGHEVLYCSTMGGKYASELNNSLDKYLPTSNRGIKKVSGNDRGAGFCCRGKSYAIIIEPFFGSHQDRFTFGAELREPLRNSIEEFLKNI